MGAWGIGNFDNDDAADWVYELAESDGTDVLVRALEAATSDGYLEAPVASAGLAAAEIVAALLGNAGKALPDDVRKWLGQNGGLEVDHDLLTLSRSAVIRVKENSE